MSKYRYYSLAEAYRAKGVTVVIDVLRAFTTAACAFTAGAEAIYPVAGIREALQLKKHLPGSMVMGEENGIKPSSFDFGNSPVDISRMDFGGKSLIQRTSAGTQGLVKAANADELYAASFVVARATADWLRRVNPETITFIVTGQSLGRDGDEDRACGEYIQALIQDEQPDPIGYIHRVRSSSAGQSFFEKNKVEILKKDYELSVQIDQFNFVMPVFRKGTMLVMKSQPPVGL